jgi:hypothetical protein
MKVIRHIEVEWTDGFRCEALRRAGYKPRMKRQDPDGRYYTEWQRAPRTRWLREYDAITDLLTRAERAAQAAFRAVVRGDV